MFAWVLELLGSFLQVLLAVNMVFFSVFSVVLVLGVSGLIAVGVHQWTNASEEGKNALRLALAETREFYKCLWYFCRGGKFSSCPYLQPKTPEEAKQRRNSRVRLFGMVLVFRLWSSPHYRHGTFNDDMLANLRNVAIPKTGVPLSLFAYSRVLSYFFVWVLYPMVCLFTAIREVGRREMRPICEEYISYLLSPTDWFSYWRLNCVLASYHSLITKEKGYIFEDKLTFLQTARKSVPEIAVSPFLELPAIICKHRNEEGGLGYNCFRNAVHGGNWIIQEVLTNDESLAKLLPGACPLSTFRVITISTSKENEIIPLSCVWRAGRAGAQTDHSAVLFDVDCASNVFGQGTTNTHWYQLGLENAWNSKWKACHDITCHPDTGKKITGETVDAKSIMDFAKKSHEAMMPKVPIVGWDVALTKEKGMLLLECNLSCNFFLGTFDTDEYFNFVEEYFVVLENASDVK